MYRVSIELYKDEWKFGRTRNAVGTAQAAGELLRHPCALVFFRSILTISPFLPHLRHMDLR